MTPIAAFGVCILATLAIILLITILTGGALPYLIFMVSSALIEETTRKFTPIRQQSNTFFLLTCLLIGVEILLVSSILFGILSLFYTFPDAGQTQQLSPQIIVAKHPLLIGINKILLFTLVYFLGTFIYYRIKFSKLPEVNGVKAKYPSPILPALSLVSGFIYLFAIYNYLTHYPSKESIGIVASIAGSLYVLYLMYSFIKTIYIHIRHRAYIFPSLTIIRGVQQIIAFIYDLTFFYFFYNTMYALKFH